MEELAQMSPDEFIKTLEKSIAEKTKDDIEAIQSLEQVEAKEEEQEQAEQEVESKKEPYIYYILSFSKLADLVAFSKTVTFEMETSELYKMNERYYLTILVDIENHPSHIQLGCWLVCASLQMIVISAAQYCRSMVKS